METHVEHPFIYRWRSSRSLIIATACGALFTETLLYGFVVPILPYMLEVRLHTDPTKTQEYTTTLLGIHGVVGLVSAPLIAHLADKTANQKMALLLSLAVCMVGTLLVALTPALWALYLGRVVQGAAGSAAWIVCLAMITETAGEKNVGKVMGMSMSFIMAGTVGGPMVGGALVEWLGYWPAWSVPLGVLLLNIIARLIVIEPRQTSPQADAKGSPDPTGDVENAETSPLLTTAPHSAQEGTFFPFYGTMLSDPRVIVSLANVITFSALIAGFNSSLPLHLRNIFDWGPLPVGEVFFLLQIPTVLLGPLAGWTRDAFGVRYPTAVSWAILVVLLIFLGIPGDDHFPWASANDCGKALFITCIASIGLVTPFIRGGGFLQVIAVVSEIESESPNAFGPHGGRSRAMAMIEVAFNIGLIIGPFLQGSLTEAIGFLYMSVIFAGICLLVAIASFTCFDSGHNRTDIGVSE